MKTSQHNWKGYGMKVIIKPRGWGKTTELIKLAAENEGYIVCHSLQEVDRISQQARDMELNIRYPITYKEIKDNPLYSRFSIPIMIDNAEKFIEYIIGNPVDWITLTLPESLFKPHLRIDPAKGYAQEYKLSNKEKGKKDGGKAAR